MGKRRKAKAWLDLRRYLQPWVIRDDLWFAWSIIYRNRLRRYEALAPIDVSLAVRLSLPFSPSRQCVPRIARLFETESSLLGVKPCK